MFFLFCTELIFFLKHSKGTNYKMSKSPYSPHSSPLRKKRLMAKIETNECERKEVIVVAIYAEEDYLSSS